MPLISNLNAWVKQSVRESNRVEKLYHQLTEEQQESAMNNKRLYNQTWGTTYSAVQWTWFAVEGETEVIRGYFKITEPERH